MSVRAQNEHLQKVMAARAAEKRAAKESKVTTNEDLDPITRGIMAARPGRPVKVSLSTGKITPIKEKTVAATRTPSAKQKATSGPAVVKASATIKKAAAPKAEKPAAKALKVPKDTGKSQADKVRAYLALNPEARPSEIAKATSVDPAYVWDIRKAVQAKAAKAEKAAVEA